MLVVAAFALVVGAVAGCSDGDGTSDGDEDADGDGFPDWLEAGLGTDPTDPEHPDPS